MREMGSSSKGWLYVVTALLFCGMIAGLAGVLLPNWFVVQCHGDGGLNPGRPTTYSFGLWSMCVGHRTQAMLTFLNGDCLTLQSALRPGYRLPVWVSGTRLLETAGAVGTVLTFLVALGFCLTPGYLASEVAKGLAFACLAAACCFLSGTLQVQQGAYRLNTFLSRDVCNTYAAAPSLSSHLTAVSICVLLLCTVVCYKQTLTFISDESETPRSRQIKIRRA